MFYTFNQNNSGGYFKPPAQYVIVEASSAKEANQIAEDNGLYFNGVENGIDCHCCGDRWWRRIDKDATKSPMIYDIDATSDSLELNKLRYDKYIPVVHIIYK